MGKAAEFCANYITKGRLVAIQGSIRVDRYETQTGENRTFTKVSARNIKPLDYVKNDNSNSDTNPSFEPAEGLDPNGFTAIDDDGIPF
ncbi:MAG: single-stranded DNA-binding protein, partial [Clostridia bacterium]